MLTLSRVKRLTILLAAAGLSLLATGCSTIRVHLSGTPGVEYHAAWSTRNVMTTTRRGKVPETFTFKDDFTGWFQNATGSGRFRVRVYQGMGLLVDQGLEDSGRKIVIERKGRRVSYRIE